MYIIHVYLNFMSNCLVYMIVCFSVVGEYCIIHKDPALNSRENPSLVISIELKTFETYIDNDIVFKKYLYKRTWCWIKISILCHTGLLYTSKRKRKKNEILIDISF